MRCRSATIRRFTHALAALAFLALSACASSTEPPGNGQSHWLDRCDDDSECGDLSCICGLCSIACTDDDACSEGRGLVCESAKGLSTADECERAPAATMLCLSRQLADRQDAAVSDSGVMDDAAMDAAMMADADAVDAARDDAGNDASDPGPPVVLPLDGFDVSCDAIEGDELATEIRAYRSPLYENFGSLTASEEAVAWGAGGTVHYVLVDSTKVTSFIEAMYAPVLDGEELFYFTGGARTLTKRSLSGGDPVQLSSQTDYLSAITLTSDSVYWALMDSSDSEIARVLRSDRDSGDTVEIGRVRAQVPGSLAVLGSFAYFLHAPGSGNSMHSIARAALDGSEPVEVLTDPIGDFGNLVSNGSSLFASISEVPPHNGPPPTDHRILRVEPDGTVMTLFETNRLWWYPSMVTTAVDARHIYWIAYATPTGPARALWRGRADGTGEPELVAHSLPDDSEHYVALSASKIYLSTQCSSDIHVLSIDKPD